MNNLSEDMIELLNSTKFFNGLSEILSLDFNKVLSLKDEKDLLEGDDMISYLLLYSCAFGLKEARDKIEEKSSVGNKEQEVNILFEEYKATLAGIMLSKRIGELEAKNGMVEKIDRALGVNLLIGAMTHNRERNIKAQDLSKHSTDFYGNDTYLIRSKDDAKETLLRSLGEFLAEKTKLSDILSDQNAEQFFNYSNYGYYKWMHYYYDSELYIYNGVPFFIDEMY